MIATEDHSPVAIESPAPVVDRKPPAMTYSPSISNDDTILLDLLQKGKSLKMEMEKAAVSNAEIATVGSDMSDSLLEKMEQEEEDIDEMDIHALLKEFEDPEPVVAPKPSVGVVHSTSRPPSSVVEKRVFSAISKACAFKITIETMELKAQLFESSIKARKGSKKRPLPSYEVTLEYTKPSKLNDRSKPDSTSIVSETFECSMENRHLDLDHCRHFFMQLSADLIDELANTTFDIRVYLSQPVPQQKAKKKTQRRLVGTAFFPLHTVLFSSTLSYTATLPILGDIKDKISEGSVCLSMALVDTDGQLITISDEYEAVERTPKESQGRQEPPPQVVQCYFHLWRVFDLTEPLTTVSIRHANPFDPSAQFSSIATVLQMKQETFTRGLNHVAIIPFVLSSENRAALETRTLVVEVWGISSQKKKESLIGLIKLPLRRFQSYITGNDHSKPDHRKYPIGVSVQTMSILNPFSGVQSGVAKGVFAIGTAQQIHQFTADLRPSIKLQRVIRRWLSRKHQEVVKTKQDSTAIVALPAPVSTSEALMDLESVKENLESTKENSEQPAKENLPPVSDHSIIKEKPQRVLEPSRTDVHRFNIEIREPCTSTCFGCHVYYTFEGILGHDDPYSLWWDANSALLNAKATHVFRVPASDLNSISMSLEIWSKPSFGHEEECIGTGRLGLDLETESSREYDCTIAPAYQNAIVPDVLPLMIKYYGKNTSLKDASNILLTDSCVQNRLIPAKVRICVEIEPDFNSFDCDRIQYVFLNQQYENIYRNEIQLQVTAELLATIRKTPLKIEFFKVNHVVSTATIPTAPLLYHPDGISGQFSVVTKNKVQTGVVDVKIYFNHGPPIEIADTKPFVADSIESIQKESFFSDSGSEEDESSLNESIVIEPLSVKIHVQEARNLLLKETNTMVNAFVSFRWPGLSTRMTSKVIYGTPSPKWRYYVVIKDKNRPDFSSFRDETLILEVYNQYQGTDDSYLLGDELIGTTKIDLSQLRTGNHQVNGWYHVSDEMQRPIGQIKVSIAPIPPSEDYDVNPECTFSQLHDDFEQDVGITMETLLKNLDRVSDQMQSRLRGGSWGSVNPQDFVKRIDAAEIVETNNPTATSPLHIPPTKSTSVSDPKDSLLIDTSSPSMCETSTSPRSTSDPIDIATSPMTTDGKDTCDMATSPRSDPIDTSSPSMCDTATSPRDTIDIDSRPKCDMATSPRSRSMTEPIDFATSPLKIDTFVKDTTTSSPSMCDMATSPRSDPIDTSSPSMCDMATSPRSISDSDDTNPLEIRDMATSPMNPSPLKDASTSPRSKQTLIDTCTSPISSDSISLEEEDEAETTILISDHVTTEVELEQKPKMNLQAPLPMRSNTFFPESQRRMNTFLEQYGIIPQRPSSPAPDLTPSSQVANMKGNEKPPGLPSYPQPLRAPVNIRRERFGDAETERIARIMSGSLEYYRRSSEETSSDESF